VPAALEGIRVIDISTSPAGAWCSRLLAGFGADVIAVEPREGHPLRRLGPFDADGTSIPAAYLLADKRAVALDASERRARRHLVELIRRSDMVVSSHGPARLEALGLTYEALGRPALIMVHVTPHGMTGSLADAPGNDLTAAARSGWASINGLASREPLKPSGWQASYCAGTVAYLGAVAALWHRDHHPGEGQEVDVSEADVLTSAFAPALLRAGYTGAPLGRRHDVDITAGPVPVADGHFALTISRAHFWRDAMNLLGLHDLADDPRWEAGWYRQQHKEEYVGRVQERMLGWKRMDLFEELGVRRVVAGPVLTMAELRENPHLQARGFWAAPEEAPEAGTYPGAPFKMSATPWRLRRPAPRAGEHTFDVLRRVAGITDDHLLGLFESGVIGTAEA
jgi:crotonobetainyl-CoA:carnitine CoA-transferase CaiB-like acyl-CoA transferase